MCWGECNGCYGFSRYTDADSGTYICISCNLQIEAEKPWLLQRVPEPMDSHGVLHTLILVTGPLELTVEEGGNQVEEHGRAIRDLRAQLAAHERVVSDRFQKMEDLLERLLAQNGPN